MNIGDNLVGIYSFFQGLVLLSFTWGMLALASSGNITFFQSLFFLVFFSISILSFIASVYAFKGKLWARTLILSLVIVAIGTIVIVVISSRFL